ncbi:MAG: ribbon-helix-helix domain-containing protein [Candidatus Bathyarchaeota archaeon]|nr:ribbon-helix-helix domain-containing protein [Candidatus Bathyarchaeota archaeon]
MTANKKRYSVTLTELYIKRLDRLIEQGIYLDHQTAIREALRRLFIFHGMEPLYKELVEESEENKLDNR